MNVCVDVRVYGWQVENSQADKFVWVDDDGGSFGLWALWLCLDPECCGRARILAMQSGGQLWGLEAGAATARLGSRRQKNVIVETGRVDVEKELSSLGPRIVCNAWRRFSKGEKKNPQDYKNKQK